MPNLSRCVVSVAFLALLLIASLPSFADDFNAQAAQVHLYVSPDGNDAWSGRFPSPTHDHTDGPLQHFDRARSIVQGLDKTKLKRITVYFRDGIYPLPATLAFTAADSGSPQTEILYTNFPGESPVFSGGIRVSGWSNTGGNTWTTTLPAGTAVFENLYVNGERRLRPRVGGYLGQYFRTFKTVYVDTRETNCPHKTTDPTDSHFGQFECFDRFDYDPDSTANNNPFADPWTNLVPAAGNLCQQNPGKPSLQGDIEILVFEQFSTSKLPVSCVDTAHHRIYLTAPTADPPPPHSSETGFIEGDRYLVENVQNALTEPGQWFLDRSAGLNKPMTLTYLAKPGEDPNRDEVVVPQLPQLLVADGLSYVTFRGLTFAHDNFTVPFPQGYVSVELEPDMSAAVSFQNSSHITFDSGTLRNIAGVGLDFTPCVFDPSSGAEPTTTPVPECVNPIPAPTLSNNLVVNSSFYDIGGQGVRLGSPYLTTFNDDNALQFSTVENNVVEGYGRTIPAAFGIGQGFGHNNLYTHNDVYDGYHCAISISTNAANLQPNGIGDAYNTISFNHVYNLLQGIMNDGGAIRVEDGNVPYVAPGNRILNNRIHDVTDASIMDNNGYGGHGIYMDNSTGLVDVENNLVYRVSDATVYTPHGPTPKLGFPNQANLIKNNILAYGRLGMIEEGNPYQYPVPIHAYEVPQSFVITNNLFYFDRNAGSTSPFQGVASPAPFYVNTGCTFTPFAYSLYQAFSSNLYWRTDGGFASYLGFNVQTTEDTTGPNAPCAGSRKAHPNLYTYYDLADWQTLVGEDAHSIVANPHFANPVYPYDDYSLRGWSWDGWAGIGFVPFDPDDAGRYRFAPRSQPPTVPATFTTMSYNPATDF